MSYELKLLLMSAGACVLLWVVIASIICLMASSRKTSIKVRLTLLAGLVSAVIAFVAVPKRDAHIAKIEEIYREQMAGSFSEKECNEHPVLSWLSRKVSNFSFKQATDHVEVKNGYLFSVGYLTGTPFGTIPATVGIMGVVIKNPFQYVITFPKPNVDISIEVRKGKRFLKVQNLDDSATYSGSLFLAEKDKADKEFDVSSGRIAALANAGKWAAIKSFFKNDMEDLVNLGFEIPSSGNCWISFRHGVRLMKVATVVLSESSCAVSWSDPTPKKE